MAALASRSGRIAKDPCEVRPGRLLWLRDQDDRKDPMKCGQDGCFGVAIIDDRKRELTMNNTSLSRLYRRLTSTRAQSVAIDAADLVSVSSGDAGDMAAERRDAVVARLAESPRDADLARMLHALQPASAALAGKVNDRRSSAHPMRDRVARPMHAARRAPHRQLRWAGGLAACLAVALGVGMWHNRPVENWQNVATSVTTAQLPDRIFTSRDKIFASSEGGAHHQRARGGDELFRGDFSG